MKKPIQYKKVTNPTTEDLKFTYDSAPYVLKAGTTEKKWPDYLAKHAAKKLADKNILTTDPNEHRALMGAYLANSTPEEIAERLGINLGRIRKKAETKKEKKARLSNLEAQIDTLRKEVKESKKEVKEEEKEEEVKEENPTPLPKSAEKKEKPISKKEEKLIKEFEEETEKNAIWHGKETKAYKEWKKEPQKK